MKIELNATIVEPEGAADKRTMTIWANVVGGTTGSGVLYRNWMKDDEGDEAAALRCVEEMFADSYADSVADDLADLRRDYDNHTHGSPS